MAPDSVLEKNDDAVPHDTVVHFLPEQSRYLIYDPSFMLNDQHRNKNFPRKLKDEKWLKTMHPMIDAVQRMNPDRTYIGKIGGGGNFDDGCRPMSLRWITEQVAEWTELPRRPRKFAEKGFERGKWNYITKEG